jgi:hypothetical protein
LRGKCIYIIEAEAAMRKNIPVFFFLIIISSNLFSQVTEEWVRRYNGAVNGYDEGMDIVVDASGNIYVTGMSEGLHTKIDFITIKYNSSGIQQWAMVYDGTANDTDIAYSVAVDIHGNVYVTGRSAGINSGWDIVTIKYNSNGALRWVQRYNSPNNYSECANSVVVDNFSNVYVTGFTSTKQEDNIDYITIKYDSSGSTS